jgi:hypothetical protein
VRVPWDAVDDIGETVRLKHSAGALGLGAVDRRTERWLRRWLRT